MHTIALFVLALSAAGIWACLSKLRNLRKQLFVMMFDRPAHATGEESWVWNEKLGRGRATGFWLWMAMGPLVFVFFLALISAVTGATGP